MQSSLSDRIRQRLRSLSFRTGIMIAAACVVCYIISFGQMLLPVGTTAKAVLWFIFFGLAKTLQYTAILILGTTGVARLKGRLRRR